MYGTYLGLGRVGRVESITCSLLLYEVELICASKICQIPCSFCLDEGGSLLLI